MSDAATPGSGAGRPVPGWHPDPLGRHELRYHNGHTWTADVAVGGQRFVDPHGGGPAPLPPPGPPAQGHTSGPAIAALVLGLVGVGLAWLPFVFVVGAVAGVLALVFGIWGRRAARRGEPGRGLATAGLVLGPLAWATALLGWWLTSEVLEMLSPGDHTVVEASCGHDGVFASLTGTIRNDSDRERSYTVVVEFRRAGTRSRIGGDAVTIRGVDAGATAPFTARARSEVSDVTCEVVEVRGALPFAPT